MYELTDLTITSLHVLVSGYGHLVAHKPVGDGLESLLLFDMALAPVEPSYVGQ